MPAKRPALAPVSRYEVLRPADALPGAEIENARTLPLDQIDVNPHQARQHFDEVGLAELTASVRQYGVLQPILVRPVGKRFEIVAGERRYRAAMSAGLPTIPALIRADLEPTDAVVVTALENLQREDLSYVDEARQYERLLQHLHCNQVELAEKLGIDHNRIWRLVRLLQEAPQLLEEIDAGRLTLRGALELIGPKRQQSHGEIADGRDQSHGEIADGREKTPRAGLAPAAATPGTHAFKAVFNFQQRMNKLELNAFADSERSEFRRHLSKLIQQLTELHQMLEDGSDT